MGSRKREGEEEEGEEEEEVAGGQDEMGDNIDVKEHILYNEGLFLELLGRLKKMKELKEKGRGQVT